MAAQFTRNAWEAEELGLPTAAVVVLLAFAKKGPFDFV
jgi:hypothetical protein